MSTTTDGGDRDDDRRPERTVRLTEQKLDTLDFHAGRLRDELLIQFGGRCGVRVSEIVGWERFESIKPYLRDPCPGTIADELVAAE